MSCGCKNKRQQWEVVADDGKGKVLFPGGTKATADAVSKRYKGSVVREKAKPEPAKRATPTITKKTPASTVPGQSTKANTVKT
ncbi:hypothetical protein [Streptomyces niveus]|uniref:hypothetical protein n=1 Tax=Streptomyces niveus TaxID=193462 RepID=UPI0036D2CAFD